MKKLLLGLFLASSMLFMPITKANEENPGAESLLEAAVKLDAVADKFILANTQVSQLLQEASQLLINTAGMLPPLPGSENGPLPGNDTEPPIPPIPEPGL